MLTSKTLTDVENITTVTDHDLQRMATGANVHKINNIRCRLVAIKQAVEEGEELNACLMKMAEVWSEIGEYFSATANALKDGTVTVEEMRRIVSEWKDAQDAIAELHAAMNRLAEHS